jgi:RNA polymerase sigma-70 factor (ECF subfamily)
MQEQLLLQKIKQGDEKAFQYVFETHYGLLCSVASEFLKDDFLAETIVGDVILYLWEKRETIEIKSSLRSYLIKAVRNKCLNYQQLQYVVKETRFPEKEELLDSEGNYIISDSQPLATLLEKELEIEIEKSINSLSDECRKVFELSRFEQLKYEDIALELNISVNTVKYHIKNALSKLRTDLTKYISAWALWLFIFK